MIRDDTENFHGITIVSLYSALSTSGEDSKRSSDNHFLYALIIDVIC